MGATIRMGLAAPTVSVDFVDGIARMDLVHQWGVSGVPTVVLNQRLSVEGPVRDDTLFEFMLHAGDDSHPVPAAASVPFSTCGRMDTS